MTFDTLFMYDRVKEFISVSHILNLQVFWRTPFFFDV